MGDGVVAPDVWLVGPVALHPSSQADPGGGNAMTSLVRLSQTGANYWLGFALDFTVSAVLLASAWLTWDAP